MLAKESKLLPLVHYFVLLIIVSLGIFYYFLFIDRLNKFLAIFTTSLFYLAWGVIHHWLNEDFHLKVFFEYFLVALLINLVIFFLLFWS